VTTYATLKSDIAGWLLRDDLTAAIPSFVRLAEAAIRRDLRIRQMLRTSTMTLTAQSMALPSDFLEMERITIDSDTEWLLQYLPPASLYSSAAYRDTGSPAYYTVEGDYLVVAPPPTDSPDALISYYRPYDALTDDADTNWLLTNAYDVYLYGSLAHASPYIKEDERVQVWVAGYSSAIAALKRRDKAGTFGSGTLSRVMTGAVP